MTGTAGSDAAGSVFEAVSAAKCSTGYSLSLNLDTGDTLPHSSRNRYHDYYNI